MRVALARPNDRSPTGLSYFTGTILLQGCDNGTVLIPESGWFEADAFVFPDESVAKTLGSLIAERSATGTPWIAVPVLERPHDA